MSGSVPLTAPPTSPPASPPASPSRTQPQPQLAMVLVAFAALSFSCMGMFVKLADRSSETSTFSLMAIRNLLGLALNACAVMAHKSFAAAGGSGFVTHPSPGEGPEDSTSARWGFPQTASMWMWLGTRCFGGFACVMLEYTALQVLPLALASMIVYSSPVFIILWSRVILGDSVKLTVVACMGVSFLGLTLILRPWSDADSGAPTWAYIAALVAAVLSGLVYVSLRELAGVRYHVVLNFFLGSGLLLSLITGFAFDDFPIPPLHSYAWGYLFAVGCSAYTAEICVTVGFALCGQSLGQISVLKLLSPMFSVMWGYAFFEEQLCLSEGIGCVLVLVSSVVILYNKTAAGAGAEQKLAGQAVQGESTTSTLEDAESASEEALTRGCL